MGYIQKILENLEELRHQNRILSHLVAYQQMKICGRDRENSEKVQEIRLLKAKNAAEFDAQN